MKGVSFYDSKGSITIEASIVVPVVFLSIIAVLYMGVLLYHKTFVGSIAASAAERAASLWDKHYDDFESGSADMGETTSDDLYRRFFDDNSDDKKCSIKKYIFSELDRYGFLSETARKADISLINYVVYRKIRIKVSCSYKNPVAGFLKIFGMKDTFTVVSGSEAILNDTPEFIRNTDFLCDVEKELEDKYLGINSIADKIRGGFYDIKKNIDDIFR